MRVLVVMVDTATATPSKPGAASVALDLVTDRARARNVAKMLADYVNWHRTEVKRTDVPWTKKKWLVLQPRLAMGLGNKMEGVISALVLAILTQRILVFEEPFIHSSLVAGMSEATKISIDNLFLPPVADMDWHYASTLLAAKTGAAKNRPPGVVDQAQAQQFTLIHGGQETTQAVAAFLCDDLATRYPQSIWTVDTNQYFVPLLQHNRHYQAKLLADFGPDLFGPLFRFFFHPLPDIQRQLDEFVTQNFMLPRTLTAAGSFDTPVAHHVFGLQIRADSSDSPWAMYVCCSLFMIC
jgi:hypothetical protein